MRKVLLLIISIIFMGTLVGCSSLSVEKKIDYKKYAKNLNERNMGVILHAGHGYAEVRQEAYVLTSTPEAQNTAMEEKNVISFNGIYNANDNTAVGMGVGSNESRIEKGNKKEQLEQEESPQFKVSYANNQYINQNTNETLNLNFIFDKLQGIEKLKPKRYTYDLSRPPYVYYELNEQEFNQIINDDLKIQYDRYKDASIKIDFQEGKANELYIVEMEVYIELEKKDVNGKIVSYYLDNDLQFDSDNLKASEKYEKMKAGRE